MTGQQVFDLRDKICETGLFWLLRGLTGGEFAAYNYLNTQDTFIARKHRDIV